MPLHQPSPEPEAGVPLFRVVSLVEGRRRPNRVVVQRKPNAAPTAATRRWSMESASDVWGSGHQSRSFTVVDAFTWKTAAIKVAACVAGEYVGEAQHLAMAGRV